MGDPLQAADSFMSSLGYQQLGPKWFDLNQVSRESEGIKFGDYAGHLAKTLERNLDNSEDWFPSETARAFSTEYYAYFNTGQTTRLTNKIAYGWIPITKSTFEAVYIAMDEDNIGAVILQYEI